MTDAVSFAFRYGMFLIAFMLLMVMIWRMDDAPADPPDHPEVVELESPVGARCFLYDSNEHGSQRYGFSCVEDR